ncbi:hypothetical protein [Antrihabitans stalactiti]|uniref:Uncharacterized protein n=1 Tax=Antrihabitans stalactiti TaxID=2584121 RepID=A0A848KGD2_9NOCA|nr:hypothetical protein [Antrihabitans stalactiti]NMN96154.1 hypothetical protein [Antrihabitans stalactiti]
MTNLITRAEIARLAHDLGADHHELAFLERARADDLRDFRIALVGQLYGEHASKLRKIASLSRAMPVSFLVRMATKIVGPELSGMVASELSPERAARLMSATPTEFAADTAAFVNPEAAGPIVRQLEPDVMLPTVVELLRRKDYPTVAKFVSVASDTQLRALVPRVPSGKDLLLAGFHTSAVDRFELVVIEMPDERIRSILAAAVEENLFAEALTLIPQFALETLGRIGDIAVAMGTDVLVPMVETAERIEAWSELIPIVAAMSPPQLRRLIGLDLWSDERLTSIITAADRDGRWHHLRPILEGMSPERLRQVATLPLVVDGAIVDRILTALHADGPIDPLVPLLVQMDPEVRQQVWDRTAGLDDELAASLVRASRAYGEPVTSVVGALATRR